MKLITNILAFLALTAAVTACSTQTERYSEGRPPAPFTERSAIPSTDQGQRMPWEVWALGRDLQGEALSDRMLIEGDELVRRGNQQQALKVYRAIDPRRLMPGDREALFVRIASAQLGLDQAKDALATLSGYFRNEKKSEADVDPRLCLLFGYAYGRLQDFDQSLAWFSRGYRVGRSAGLAEPASVGVRLLLRSVEDTPLYALSERWRDDAFVHQLLGQERRRRVQAGYQAVSSKAPFWNPESAGAETSVAGSGALLGSDHSVVGVILPLSGPFAALGRGTKQGIELAFEGKGLSNISLEVRDDSGDALQSVAAARELVGSAQSSVVLGPLLTEAALQVSDFMRTERRPIISFAKSGEIPPGNGVLRLGPTAESQISSLMQRVDASYRYTRYGLVFPRDAAGEEFAQLFRSRVQDLGLQLAYENSYQRDDFSAIFAIAQEAREQNLEAIFFPDSLRAAARFFSYLNVGGGKQVRPLGSASWDSPAELQQSRAVMDGAVFVSPFFRASERPEIAKFVASYRSRYGIEPDFLAAQGFDAATIALESLQRAMNAQETFEDGLRAVGLYHGLTGSIAIRSDGALDRTFTVVEFEQGSISELGDKPILITDRGMEANEVVAPSLQHGDSLVGETR